MNSNSRIRKCFEPVRRAEFRCRNWSCLWTWQCGWTPARCPTGYTFFSISFLLVKLKYETYFFKFQVWQLNLLNLKASFFLIIRIGENNPPFSFAIFSNSEEETQNAFTDLDSNWTFFKQVHLHVPTDGLVDLASCVHLFSFFRLWIRRLLHGSQQRAFRKMLRVCHSLTAAPHLAMTIRTSFLLVLLPLVHLFHRLPKIMIVVATIIMKNIVIMIILIAINIFLRNRIVVMMLVAVAMYMSHCNVLYIHNLYKYIVKFGFLHSKYNYFLKINFAV